LPKYKSISGLLTHRTEIQTARSTTSIDVRLTAVSFSPTSYKIN